MGSSLVGLWAFTSVAIVLLLPGVAWLAWLPETRAGLVENLADAIGLSLALTALVALAAFLLGWRISAASMLALYLLVGLLATLGIARRVVLHASRPARAGEPAAAIPQEEAGLLVATPVVMAGDQPARQSIWHNPLFRNAFILFGFLCLIAWRFYQVRQLALPAWVDSLHHVLIVRLFLEHGGIPPSLEPYLPVPFYYHYAFHASAAAFSFWSRLSQPQAVLWFGQVLNAVVALSVYRLGAVLWAGWQRPALAALITGFFLQMPAYYVTWGRYTLLAGLALLPLAIAAAHEIAQRGITVERLVRLGILTAGILLAHYFAALLLALYLILLGLQTLLRDLRHRQVWARGKPLDWRHSRALGLVVAALSGVLLASPWIYRVWSYAGNGLSVEPVLSEAAADATYFPNYLGYLWRMLGPNRSYVILFLAPLGLLVAFIRPSTRIFALWSVVLGLFSLPWGLHLAPFRPDHTVIVLFIPLSLLVADFFVYAGAHFWDQGHNPAFDRVGRWALGAALVSLFIWSLVDTRDIINPATVIASPADVQAIGWITIHTPPDTTFLINVAYWQSGTYRGVDGGWWIPLLTGRNVLLPSVLYEWANPAYRDQVNALAEKVSSLKGCTPDFWELVRSVGVQYIFLGTNPGSLRLADLEGCTGLQQVYSDQGVSIWQVIH